MILDLLQVFFSALFWFGPPTRRTMPKPSRAVMDRSSVLQGEAPDTWFCVVILRRESSKSEDRPDWNEGVLRVDDRGLTLFELPATETFVPWAEIADVRVVPHGHYNTELIHVTGRDKSVTMRFGAVETTTYELTSEQLWDLAAQIRALRSIDNR
jgi:hypothetical protein